MSESYRVHDTGRKDHGGKGIIDIYGGVKWGPASRTRGAIISMRHRYHRWTAAAAIGCVLLLAACGSTSTRNPALVAKARQAALAHAQCMREHGVPNFPDPTISTNGGGIVQSSGGRGLNPQSPAFQQAQKICQPNSPR